MSTDSKTIPTFKERVLKEGLTHAGTPRQVGDTIEVTEAQREFLRKRGFIASTAAADKAPAATKGA